MFTKTKKKQKKQYQLISSNRLGTKGMDHQRLLMYDVIE